jgi:hypothetical protein
MDEVEFEKACNALRVEFKGAEKSVRGLLDHSRFNAEQAFSGQHGEMKANLMLAVRHLEDARMRLGKAIQYAGNGVSCYDK